MCVIKFFGKLVLRIMLIPVWILLALAWILVMMIVRVGCMAKGLASSVLLFILIGTLIWFRMDWMRYILLAIAEGILLALVFAGVIVEIVLGAARERVGGFILFGY